MSPSIAAAALTAATFVTVALGLGIATPIAAVAIAATGHAAVAHFLFFGPLSSLIQIKRVTYGFPSKASCARRAADEAVWRGRMRQRQATH